MARKRSGLLHDDFSQILTLNKLHHEKRAMALGKVVADARQHRMIQPGHQAGFTFELSPEFFIRGQCLLKRDGVAQPEVNSFVDRAHPTASQVTNDTITAL